MGKLTLKELAPYLPYGLNVKPFKRVKELNESVLLAYSNEFHLLKPILRPLSDLTKCKHIGINKKLGIFDNKEEIELFIKKTKNRFIKVFDYDYLLYHHYDIFGLIEKGLAIDINSLVEM